MVAVIEETLRTGHPREALRLLSLDLAHRIDADPGDDAVVRLSRELRLVLEAVAEDSADDVEAFLERVAAPAFRHPEN
jgi:hypothetical protein